MPSEVDKSLDSLLPKLGGFGRFQGYIFCLVSITVILNGLVYLSFVFTARIVDHRCKIEECESSPPEYMDEWVKLAIPRQKHKRDKVEKCLKYKRIEGSDCNDPSSYITNTTEKCNDFVYADKTRTIMHEFNLQCSENVAKLSVVGTIQNAGQFFGLWSYGYAADRIGRRNMLVVGCILSGITGIAKFIYLNYWTFVVCEFLDCLVGRGSYICSYVLITEVVPTEWRAFMGNTMGVVGAVGQVLLAWLDYGMGDWKWTTLAIHLPEFFIISYLLIMPESIRWQLVKGKVEAAKKTLRLLAKVNRVEAKEEDLAILDDLQAQNSDGVLSKSMLKSAIRSKILMTRFILYCYLWTAKNFLYYGITLNSVYITPNKYMDFSLTAAIDIPAHFVTGYVAQRFGRRYIMFFSFMATAVPFVIFIFVSQYDWAKLMIWLVGKFAAGMTGGILYIWCTELFPTYLRQTFMGTISSVGRIGGMLAPLHPLLENVWGPLPLILYAAVAGLGGIVCLTSFPETKNKKLPDTVKEAENIKDAPILETKF